MKNIFIGNLDSGTTPASIRSFFKAYGTIGKVNLMVDRETGVSRGFAFLEMADIEGGRAIAELNGLTLEGRAVDVHEARPILHRVRPPQERSARRL